MVFYNSLVRMSLTPTWPTGERARWHRESHTEIISQKDLTTPSSGSQSNGRATQRSSSHLISSYERRRWMSLPNPDEPKRTRPKTGGEWKIRRRKAGDYLRDTQTGSLL